VAAALVSASLFTVAACGQAPQDKPIEAGAPATPSSPTSEATTTSAPAPPSYPLTGELLADVPSAHHPAVVVKMDNTPEARPQSGINEADIVYELIVEGYTRYALVFHSQAPDPVGPVRSARSSDIELVSNLGRPILAWSGGNPGVVGEVRGAADNGFLIDAMYGVSNDYYRDSARVMPHNLYTRVPGLFENFSPPDAGPPPPLFSYRAAGAPYTGGAEPTSGIRVDFGEGTDTEYVWDAERGGWDRFQVDGRHKLANSATVDANGVQVAPQNVVILFLEYGVSSVDARSPLAISTGSGEAMVLTDGKLVRGRWSRENPLMGWTLTDNSGNPIKLTPGRTWVGLPEVGSAVTPLDAGEAGELLALRR
jgi:hypothetical protein